MLLPLQCTSCQGHPAGRRAHSLVAMSDRFLLLHGGYSGTCDLLQDTWVFDIHRSCWLRADVTGEAADDDTDRSAAPC